MNFHFKHLVWTALLMLLVAAQAVYACGVNWSLPKDHFDGVNERGYVSIWDQIGELDLGEDLKIPLITGFDSKREWSSPHVGHGFILALLDSRFEQVDEGTFYMLQPDGWTTVFRRERKNKNILGGQGGWKAEIGPDTITAHASCGWKLVYRQGKIESIGTPKNETLSYIYSGNRVSEIRCQGKVILEVKTDPMSGMVTALVMGSKQINLKQRQRPQVQRINGQNLVGAVSSALSEVVQSDSQTKSYVFAVDEKRYPTLTLNKERVIVWDPETKRIMRDGDWTYQITPSKDPQFYAAIGRTNLQKQAEFWHLDAAKGTETIQRLDGSKKIKTWFTTGKLAGKIRKITEIVNGIEKVTLQTTYSEDGLLIRKVLADGTVESLCYDKNKKLVIPGSERPTPEQLDATEAKLLGDLQKASEGITKGSMDDALFELALFTVEWRGNIEKARELASEIQNPRFRFGIILQTYEQDKSLTVQEKITRYESLFKEFPEQQKFLSQLIKIRMSEI